MVYKRWIWPVLLLLAVLLWFIIDWQKPRHNSSAKNNQTATKVSTQANRDQTDSNAKQPNQVTDKLNTPVDTATVNAWLKEINDPLYSHDPVIELASLNAEMLNCESIKYNNHPLLSETDEFAPMFQLRQRIASQCETMAQQYPQWYNTHTRTAKLLELTPNSAAGKKLHNLHTTLFSQDQDFNYDQFTSDRNQLAVDMKNAPLTSMAAMDQLNGLWFNHTDDTLFRLLQTQDGLWIHTASELAYQKLSCTYPNSRSCAATSVYMWRKCEADTSACGQDFEAWYDRHTSAGMKKDVIKMMAYLGRQTSE